ncbi:uncharacterized protein Z518_08139 [Rhinocladiella mackenziei CBS 650.93]|uniref:SnoaL-like domain-containing protein n=1 Tax=Rhinocladiella mackenziei CBS 650.93 TaxID=1442369 RepID=A0A0D2IZY8_9EURO|nr:uncharacterized protein Z518_08139 [Rhinocladiella mackenziei CBS 650.93]KIX02200.1 hypothetical protein Z518_08139 [Rhinocladiella mackenziei CBS 650.93]
MYDRDPYTFANNDLIPKPILDVITGILKSWDMAETDYRYIDMFQPDGILHVAPEPSSGREAMKSLHDNLIHPQNGPLVDLQHYLDRVFLMPGNTGGKTEVVFTGKLDNFLANGEKVTTDFATWVILSESQEVKGALRADLVRVFSDCSALFGAIEKMMSATNGANGAGGTKA